MTASGAIRWSGAAGIIGGLVCAAAFLFHPKSNAQGVLSGPYLPVHAAILASIVLMLLCLVGLYAAQVRELGVSGLVAFGLSFLGLSLLILVIGVDGFVTPLVVTEAPTLRRHLFEGSPLATLMAIQGISLSLGFLAFCLATWRARVLPYWPAALTFPGALILGVTTSEPLWLESRGATNLGGVLFGLGLAWFGYALWTGRRRLATTQRPGAAAAPATPD